MTQYRSKRKRKNSFQLTNEIKEPLDLYEHLPFQVAVVSNLLQLNRDFAIREFIDLEPRELRVMLNIGSYMPISSADIAYQSRMDAYTVSRAVKKLASLDMIRIVNKEDNKKVKYLTLTDEGLEVYRKLTNEIEERTQFLESVISEDEKSQLMTLLAKLEDRAEKMLAEHAMVRKEGEQKIPSDQQEIIRWFKKSNN